MKVKQRRTVTLVLNDNEAKWLHDYMQNYHRLNGDPVNESHYDKEMRRIFFEATSKDLE